MKIGIDCRELRGQAGGFRTYLVGLLEGLTKIDTTNKYILYAYSSLDFEGIVTPTNAVFAPIGGGRLWADWVSLPKRIQMDNPDVVHFPANYGITGVYIPTVVTLHDCISLEPQERCMCAKSRLLRKYSAIMTQRSVTRADIVITVSNYSKEQIMRRFSCAERIVVTHEAARITADGEVVSTDSNEVNSQPYLLALASVDRRKNTAVVMRAFSMTRLSREKCRLVVVASHPSAKRLAEQQAVELGIQPMVDIRTGVDDLALRRLYQNCKAFVFPSLDEGFGLPPLEAMALGAAVMSSDRASMPEVLGDAALYFDPTDPTDLANKMDALIGQEALRTHLREAGRQRAASFSWEDAARGTLGAYERAAGNT